MAQSNRVALAPTRDEHEPGRPCPLCCPLDGHVPDAAVSWLQPTATLNPEALFIFQVVRPLPDPLNASERRIDRVEQVAAARLYAALFGERALAQAISKARSMPLAHGEVWDPFWSGLAARLHKRGVS